MKHAYVCNVRKDDNVLPLPRPNFGLIPDPRLKTGAKPKAKQNKAKAETVENEETLNLPDYDFGETDGN
ncbi:MAG: hypothetical protein IT426_20170 [Pirellulales bacterium]|nr:hypothetical protein [Pirellulales bacterium]